MDGSGRSERFVRYEVTNWVTHVRPSENKQANWVIGRAGIMFFIPSLAPRVLRERIFYQNVFGAHGN